MKRKEKDTLRSSTLEELRKKLVESTRELARMQQERYTKQSKNVRQGKSVRLHIARISTLIREKELTV